MFTDNNESEIYQVLRKLFQRLFCCYLRTAGQTHKLRYAALNVIIQTVLQVNATIEIISFPSYIPLWFSVPGSRTTGSPHSSALNCGDVSQRQGQPIVQHTQNCCRMGCTRILDVSVFLLINLQKET